MMLTVLAASYSFYIFFTNSSNKERAKAVSQKKIQTCFNLIADDIRHAGFGLQKNNNSSICLFSIHDNCSAGDESFCKNGTDRLFIANGWQIIRDFTNDNCPDGDISNSDYETLSNGNYHAKATYSASQQSISYDKLDIDSKCRGVSTFCGGGGCEDIKDNKAIIVCGCKNSLGKYGQEGRRVSSIDNVTRKINFLNKEAVLNYDNCTNGSIIPANVWYVKKASDGEYWLYRNENKVMNNILNFQVCAGYDTNGDGIINGSFNNGSCSGEYLDSLPENADIKNLKFIIIGIETYYKWKNKTYPVFFKSSTETFH
jgi:hypothetical protein